MKPTFHVSDKVVLLPEWAEMVYTIPRLVPGRVYCVERVNLVCGNLWLRLVGVRENKLKCYDDRGAMAIAFRHAGRSGSNQQKEAA